jgi:CRISPR/Cas system CSM-associated protein Csm3 (group 7 of RAMP superfamily)
MKVQQYKIELFDYWSATSGLSGGALADSLCIKDANNLPFIPGKTIKGLIREGLDDLKRWHPGLFSNQFINDVFGEVERKPDDSNEQKRTKISKTFFSNATLDSATAQAIIKEKIAGSFFEFISSTAIDERGIAEDGTLRRLEFAIPCTLYGIININELSSEHISVLKLCTSYVKRLGLGRHRGYGRCKITLL